MMANDLPQPVTPKNLIRVLVVIIIGLAFLAGYYHSAWQLELKKNAQWEESL